MRCERSFCPPGKCGAYSSSRGFLRRERRAPHPFGVSRSFSTSEFGFRALVQAGFLHGHWSISVMRQLARVGNLGAGDGPNLVGRNSNDRGGFAGESDKLDLVSLMARIDVNDCANVAALKTFLGKWGGQDDSIVFVNHVGKLLEGMGGDQSWFVGSTVDDPDGANRRRAGRSSVSCTSH